MDFVVFRKFNDQERVEAIVAILREHHIEFQVTEDRDSLDGLYGGSKLTNYYVKLKQADFARTHAVLQSLGEEALEHVEKDHYLYAFTDEELFEVLSKPDEWNEMDYQLSKRILKERGKEINNDTIELLKQQRIRELAKPEESQRAWIYAGYIFSLLGGLLGIFIGWHLSSFKKTLPNGQRVYGYAEADRKHGSRILIIGIAMFFITAIVRLQSI
jgi:hypothetical protein